MSFIKRNWILASIAALSLGGTFTSVSLADDFGKMGRGNPDKMFKQLNLTAEQKEKIKKLREESKDDHKKEREEMKAQAEAFKKKMASDASDSDLKKDFENLQEKRAEMAKDRFEQMLKVRAILTPEQRKKFAELNEKKMKHHKGKRGKKQAAVEDDEE